MLEPEFDQVPVWTPYLLTYLAGGGCGAVWMSTQRGKGPQQELLNSPNLADPAQKDAFLLCKENRPKYEERVKALAAAYAAELC